MLAKDSDSCKVKVHAPRSSMEGINRCVFAYGVLKEHSIKDLLDCIEPRAFDVQRLLRNGSPTTTCRITFHSQELTERVISRGDIRFDGYTFFRVARPYKKANRICSTCKLPTEECKSGKKCNKIRCGNCGEGHVTKECLKDLGSVACIRCGNEGHIVFNCPSIPAAPVKQKKSFAQTVRDGKKQKPAAFQPFDLAKIVTAIVEACIDELFAGKFNEEQKSRVTLAALKKLQADNQDEKKESIIGFSQVNTQVIEKVEKVTDAQKFSRPNGRGGVAAYAALCDPT